MKLKEVASRIGARLDLLADAPARAADVEITGVAAIEEAGRSELAFVTNPKYAAAARTTQAAAIIVAEDFPPIPRVTLRSANPHLAYAKALELFHRPPRYEPTVHPTAAIAKSSKIGANAHIGAYVVIEEDVEIGANCVLLPHVVIYRGVRIGDNFFAHAHAVVRENCRIGNNVLLQNGVVIGADGFGVAKTAERHWHKRPQPAPVGMGDDVEVQANSCVDRAHVGQTRTHNGVKVDKLSQAW